MTAVQRLLRGVLAHSRTLGMQRMLHSNVTQRIGVAHGTRIASSTSALAPWRAAAQPQQPRGWASSFSASSSSSSSAVLDLPESPSARSALQPSSVPTVLPGVSAGGLAAYNEPPAAAAANTAASTAAPAANGAQHAAALGTNGAAAEDASVTGALAATAPAANPTTAATSAGPVSPPAATAAGKDASNATAEDAASPTTAAPAVDAAATPKATRRNASPKQRSSVGTSSGGGSSSSSSTGGSGRRSSPEVIRRRQLLSVKGLGPKYVQLLSEKAYIMSLDDLMECFTQENKGSEEAMKEFLQSKVGIRNSAHAVAIAKDIKLRCQPHKLTFCVEGNISAGKSTFLDYIGRAAAAAGEDGSSSGSGGSSSSSEARLGDLMGSPLTLVPEPVDQWQHVNGGNANILEQFYADPQRFAYTFQNYVFLTRMLQERRSAERSEPVRIMERSVFSDRMVFVRAVMEKQWMTDVELALYDSWFDPMLCLSPSLMPDGFIYLKTDPDVCMQRLHKRGRAEESSIDMDYLLGLHSKHEDWLGAGVLAQQKRSEGAVHGLLSAADAAALASYNGNGASSSGSSSGSRNGRGGSQLLLPDVPAELQDCLYFLDKGSDKSSSEMLQQLDQVPALVLDTNADVFQDKGLAEEHQKKVAAYVQFMQKLRKLRGGVPLKGATYAQPYAVNNEEMVDKVQKILRAVDSSIRAVPTSNGQLVGAAAASGALEALTELMARGSGGSQKGRAAGGSGSLHT